MKKFPDELPRVGQTVVVYTKRMRLETYICRYMRVLTWRGFKLKFVGITSKGFWLEDDKILGWNRLPNNIETLP